MMKTLKSQATFATLLVSGMAIAGQMPLNEESLLIEQGGINSMASESVAKPKVSIGNDKSSVNLTLEQTKKLAEKVAEQGDLSMALRLYDAVLAKHLSDENALKQSTILLSQQRQHKAALKRHHQLLLLNSNDVSRQANHSVLLLKAGNPVSAAELMHTLLEQKPQFHSVRNNLARLLTDPKNSNFAPVHALPLAHELNKLTNRNNPVYLDTLAAAQYWTGDSAAAAATARTAVDKALQRGMLPLAKAISAQVSVYETTFVEQ